MATPSSSSLRLTSRTSSPSSSEFVQFTATMRLPIPPVFSINSNGNQELSGSGTGTGGDGGMEGVKEVLAGWVMRYLPPLHAVVLSFDSNPRFLHPEALFDANACPFETNLPSSSSLLPSPPPTPPTNSNGNKTTAAGYDEEEKKKLEEGELVRLKTLPMIDGSGFTLADVEWKGLGWAPRVGMKLVGTPTLSTSSHVSLLLHNLFNASIPSSHIPQDLYEFDPSFPVPAVVLERRQQTPKPTKSLEELAEASKKTQREALGIEGDDAEDSDGDDEDKEDIKMDEEEEEEEFEEQGWWVDKKTRQPLGGQQGRIEFTLVSLSTSNSLLSCTGSLLSDPFTPSALASLSDPSSTSSTSSSALLQAQTIRSGHSQTQPRLSDDSDSDSDSNSSSSDDEGEAASGDDDDGVGTGIPLHQGAPSKSEDPSKSDSEDSDDSSSSSSESDASSRSPSPEPVPEKKGKRTKAEKKGKPPVVGSSKVETKVVPTTTTVTEEKAAKKDKKEKKRKEAGSPEKGTERKSKKSRKE
ncbi:hypothetical protein JCM16303_003180 [Sporobolomyces ruberrimus]